MICPIDELQPLLQRANALPEFYQGYLDGYVKGAVAALRTGLEVCEKMAADKTNKSRAAEDAGRAPLRLVPGVRLPAAAP